MRQVPGDHAGDRRNPSRYAVQALERALDILEVVAARPARVPEIAARLRLHRATVFRLITNLESRRYVRRDDAGVYCLGRRLLELSANAFQTAFPPEIIRPLLRELADVTGETAQIWVRDGLQAVCMDQIDSPGDVKLSSRVGRILPLNCGGVAKALLAWAPQRVQDEVLSRPLPGFTDRSIRHPETLIEELQKVRACGFAYSAGEVSAASRGVAAPVFDSAGEVNAAVGILAPFDHVDDSTLPSLSRSVIEVARRLSARLDSAGQRRVTVRRGGA